MISSSAFCTEGLGFKSPVLVSTRQIAKDTLDLWGVAHLCNDTDL